MTIIGNLIVYGGLFCIACLVVFFCISCEILSKQPAKEAIPAYSSEKPQNPALKTA